MKFSTTVALFVLGSGVFAGSCQSQAQTSFDGGQGPVVTVSLPNNTNNKISAGNVSVKVSVERAAPNSSFTVQVNITNSATSTSSNTVTGTITTDASGNGSVTVTVVAPAGTSGDSAKVTAETSVTGTPTNTNLDASYQ